MKIKINNIDKLKGKQCGINWSSFITVYSIRDVKRMITYWCIRLNGTSDENLRIVVREDIIDDKWIPLMLRWERGMNSHAYRGLAHISDMETPTSFLKAVERVKWEMVGGQS